MEKSYEEAAEESQEANESGGVDMENEDDDQSERAEK